MNILVEASDLSFNDKFKKASSDEVDDVIFQFLKTILANIPDEQLKEFVRKNISLLYSECKRYTLSEDNPFIIYLNKYNKKNGNIDPFLSYENYAFIHNLLANRKINEKQLAFNCPEDEQIRILLNPNLFLETNSDKNYLVDIYSYILSANLNNYIKNDFIKSIFNGQNLKDITSKIELLMLLYFTDYLQTVNDNGIKSDKLSKEEIAIIQEEAKNKIQNKALVSSKFISVDLIEHQFKLLSELTQESSRDEYGKQQQTDIDNKSKEEKSSVNDRWNEGQKRTIRSKIADIKKSFETIYNDGEIMSRQDFKDLLNAIYKEL